MPQSREPSKAAAEVRLPSADIKMPIAGWHEAPSEANMRVWQHPSGATLSLTFVADRSGMPNPASVTQLRIQCRHVAEERNAGLIEADDVPSAYGPSGMMIYKRLNKPAFIFTGMAWIPHENGWLVWTMVEGERGTTGVREAVITTELFKAGTLTLEGYKTSWAQDPYDPEYHGVDHSTQRYMSDDEKYDERFPDHPLSHVRRVMRALVAQTREH